MIYSLQNRKMPSPRTVRLYLFATVILAFLSGIFPFALFFTMLAVALASVALLSIPRITYPRILLILTAISLPLAALLYLLTRNAATCLSATAFAPAVAMLTLTIRRRKSRTCGIILAAVGMGIFYLACYALAIYLTYNRFSLELFKELYVSIEETFLAYIDEYMNAMPMAEMLEFDEELLLESLRLIMTLLPAIFIDLILGTVWLATVLLRMIFKGYLYGEERFRHWRVTMNRPSALLFCLSSLLMILPYPESASYLTPVFTNLMLILLPGFICVGCSMWKDRLSALGRAIPVPIILLLVLLAFFTSPIIILYFAALTGATNLLFPRIKPKQKENDS